MIPTQIFLGPIPIFLIFWEDFSPLLHLPCTCCNPTPAPAWSENHPIVPRFCGIYSWNLWGLFPDFVEVCSQFLLVLVPSFCWGLFPFFVGVSSRFLRGLFPVFVGSFSQIFWRFFLAFEGFFPGFWGIFSQFLRDFFPVFVGVLARIPSGKSFPKGDVSNPKQRDPDFHWLCPELGSLGFEPFPPSFVVFQRVWGWIFGNFSLGSWIFYHFGEEMKVLIVTFMFLLFT